MAALEEASAWARESVLVSARHRPLSRRIVEWLFSRWFMHDRFQLATDEDWGRRANFRVAVAHHERPEAWKLLEEWTRQAAPAGMDLDVFRELPLDALARLLREAPEHHQSAARLLMLPLPELIAHFGQSQLLRRIERVARDESVAQKVSYSIKPGPRAICRALDLLVEWPEARPALRALLCDFSLAEGVRCELLDRLFVQDRAMVLRWALVAVRYPDNALLVRFVLECAAKQPEPGDRPLFLAALRGEDDEARATALEGLFALGESGAGWCDRLISLVHSSHERVRLCAAACLVREGMREWLPLLREKVLEVPESAMRLVAIHWLGRVDAEGSRPVLRQLLAEAPTGARGYYHPGADEAAWALSRLGTTEDLSVLLAATLRGTCSPRTDRELEYHLARQEGRPTPEVPPPLSQQSSRRLLGL
ncbi:hypothetical protein JY651_05545 [Pyxidicoccus parkwayensis]|uniref:HEAT repeat domain-containing protein n=1 Tax=Pyxidicoccus parkwayensis TaxID=2813578 RepID=A0ABX7NZQ7_9BACT|nr:HEAT repeat domain-containing protein [Pyxidicoccus parkwaysis]QSQ24422.1 hypothetical protein JY651_05545 [Pyxidicoccus parkwaysis]